ncbi:MAG: hypothetical protein Kow00127_16250 [Bacteroidales bacterium]
MCFLLLIPGLINASEVNHSPFLFSQDEQAGAAALLERAEALLEKDTEKSLVYLEKAIVASEQTQDTSFLIQALKFKTDLLLDRQAYDSAYNSLLTLNNLTDTSLHDTLAGYINENLAFCLVSLPENNGVEHVYFNRAEKIYSELNWKLGLRGLQYNFAYHAYLAGEYDKATMVLQKCLGLAETSGDTVFNIVVHNLFGVIYLDLGNHKQSLRYFETSLDLAHKIKNKYYISMILSNLGLIYLEYKQYEKALEYFQQSLAIESEINKNLTGSYNNIGLIYSKLQQRDLAIEYFEKARREAIDSDDKAGEAYALTNLGDIYSDMGEIDKAFDYLKRALSIIRITGNEFDLAEIYQSLSAAWLNNGDAGKALIYNDSAMALAKSGHWPAVQATSADLYSTIYQSQNQLSQALEWKDRYIGLKDSIFDATVSGKLAEINFRNLLNSERENTRRMEIKFLEKAKSVRLQRIYLIIILVLVVVFVVLVWIDFRSKNRINRQLSEANNKLQNQQKELAGAYEELRQNELKYRTLVKNAPIGIMLLDHQGNILEINQRLLNLLGSPDEAITRKINCLTFPPLVEVGLAEDIRTCLRERKTVQREAAYKSQWGAELYLRVYVTPVINGNNEVNRIIFTAEDVSLYESVRRQITESEKKYRSLVEYSLQALAIIQSRRIVFGNSRLTDLTGYKKEEWLNAGLQWFREVVFPDDLSRLILHLTEMFKDSNSHGEIEFRIVCRDGSVRWVEALCSINEWEGKPAIMMVALDITARKQALTEMARNQEELRQANAMKDKFFSIIAHDLKNPFNAILGFSNLLNDAYDSFDDGQRKAFIKNITDASENTFKLLQNLLEWSRTQTGAIDYQPAVIDLNNVVAETLKTQQASAKRKKIKFTVDIPISMTVLADNNMLQTILRNLVSNAVKFTPSGGVVAINAEAKEGNVEISVTDTGIGISPKDKENLFRIDKVVLSKGTDNETGSGLGLILCHELVARHGGWIWVESEPGKGSTFRFTLQNS